MVSLEPEGAAGDVGVVPGPAGGAGALEVLVDEDAVVEDPLEARVGDLVALVIEPRRAERDVERLPFARRAAGIGAGRLAVVGSLGLLDPTTVDAAARAVGELSVRGAPTVQHLDLILALEVDPRV